MGCQRHAPVALSPGKRHGTHRTGHWLAPRAPSGTVLKTSPPPPTGIPPRTVQPVASHYTDWAIPAPFPSKDITSNCIRNDGKQSGHSVYQGINRFWPAGTRNPRRSLLTTDICHAESRTTEHPDSTLTIMSRR